MKNRSNNSRAVPISLFVTLLLLVAAPAASARATSALWRSVMDFDVEGVRTSLESGADPNERREPPQSDTPLLFASGQCARSGSPRIAQLLLQHGADPNLADENNASPLVWAAQSCPANVVRMLLDAGADPRMRAKGSATPLMMALVMKRFGIAKILIDTGQHTHADLEALQPIAASEPEAQRLLALRLAALTETNAPTASSAPLPEVEEWTEDVASIAREIAAEPEVEPEPVAVAATTTPSSFAGDLTRGIVVGIVFGLVVGGAIAVMSRRA